MNNLLKTLTICGVSLVPLTSFAESNTVYGDFRYSYNNIDNGTDSTISGNNNATRLGFKGDIGEKKGITAFYHLQFGANVDGDAAGKSFGQRFFFAGIKGDFGKLAYGRTSTPYKMAGLKNDPFYDTSAGSGFGGSNYGLSPTTNGWSDNTIAYSSPKLGNFTLNASTYLDDTDANEHDTNIGVFYKQNSFSGGIQYMNVGDTGVVAKSIADSTSIRVHGEYKSTSWSFAASVETIDVSAGDSQQYAYINATYKSSADIKWAASYGSVSDVSEAADGTGLTFGVFYQLLEKTTLYGLYSSKSSDDYTVPDDTTGNFKQLGLFDRDVLSIGISHKFSFTI